MKHENHWDVAVIGAGAAGLMAGYSAAQANPKLRVVVLEGASRIGAKILVSGGGRCNVTHYTVSEKDFCGAAPKAIRKILRRFPVEKTVSFFQEYGVELVQEPTGKLFPAANKARVVVNALVQACKSAGVTLKTRHRVVKLISEEQADGYRIECLDPELENLSARKVILATGGLSLPKSGSDGWGLRAAQSLTPPLKEPLIPALVPLLVEKQHPLLERAGLTLPAKLILRSSTRKKLWEVTGSLLITHVGLSGPAALDMSRHYLRAQETDPGAHLVIHWIPDQTDQELDSELQNITPKNLTAYLARSLPRRLVETLLGLAGIRHFEGGGLAKNLRRALISQLTQMEIPITGDQGFHKAEVTAGGVPLSEVHLKTLESRKVPGLHFAGEVLDVDGRIGGFNFQWAWASGYVSGTAAAVCE